MKSIMQQDKEQCYMCGSNGTDDMCGLEEHHVLYGQGRKHLSEKYGLKVYLCGTRCHRLGPNAPHENEDVRKSLEAEAQKAFERVHGTREDFRRIFGKYCT